jgi:hypothetical protein
MKQYYFRNFDGEYYLVPLNEVEAFDECVEACEDSETSESAYDEFNDKFWQYKREGDFYSTILNIEEL